MHIRFQHWGLWLLVPLFLFSCRLSTPQVPATQPTTEVSTPKAQTLRFSSLSELQAALHWTPETVPMISAHRGGPVPGFPENCIPTFEHTLSITPAMLEMDISRSRDGQLFLLHDNTLDRTTTGSGPAGDHNWEQLQELRLVDNEGNATDFKIPTLQEVLEWGRGKCLMSLDIKQGVPLKEVIEAVEAAKAEHSVVLITYNNLDAEAIHRFNPDLMISASIRNFDELKRFQDTGVPLQNVIAFTGTRTKEKAFYDKLHALGIRCILGTLGNLDKSAAAKGNSLYEQWHALGADIFATDRPAAVAETFFK
ncbi:MAG: glycerophosphodiester phosphodiesterase family protein [Phaeodactylibacter sp.]|nr:glycerophosphodiester phosphodiesterase family protein [Phaeodactylibacter sp.]